MGKKKIFTISKQDGTTEEVEEVISFEFSDTKKQYIVYTKNEIDDAGNVTVYVTQMVHEGNKTKFVGVSGQDEWDKIKNVLRELAAKE